MTDLTIPLPANKPARLLFVDDEPNVLKALNRLFRNPDYQIFTAESGKVGLEILETNEIDLIISDMRMPQMDGAEFLSKVAESWPETIRILLTGFADMESTIIAVNKGKIYSYCSKPWEDTELKTLVKNAIEQKRLRDERRALFEIINDQNQQLKELNASLEDKVEKRTEQLKKSLQVIEHAHDALNRQYSETIKAFAKIIEMRPGIKSGHSKYIAENAREVALHLHLDATEVKDILHAGLLLQIGKMGLPDYLLNQPLNSLSDEDKSSFFHHALEGQDLLKGMEPLHKAAELISQQYESFDGSGYPNGLTGSRIPTGARILAIIRDYINYLDGSITGHVMTTEQAKSQLSWGKETCYDPDILDIFLDLLGDDDSSEERPVVEISWTQLQAGMEAAEIICHDVLYLKDQVLTQKSVDDILKLRENNKDMILRIRLGNNGKLK